MSFISLLFCGNPPLNIKFRVKKYSEYTKEKLTRKTLSSGTNCLTSEKLPAHWGANIFAQGGAIGFR